MKYRVKFLITNLNVVELRDFKIGLVDSDYVLEFNSDNEPRLPKKSEIIKIGDRKFQMDRFDIEWIHENNIMYNIFNVYLFDVDVAWGRYDKCGYEDYRKDNWNW